MGQFRCHCREIGFVANDHSRLQRGAFQNRPIVVADRARLVEHDQHEIRDILLESLEACRELDDAILRLAHAHHANCLADPVLNHHFTHGDGHPQHVERLAAYWAEVLGGPPRFSEGMNDESAVLYMHSGIGEVGDLGDRFHDCFVRALDDAGLPDDPEFRAAMSAYMRAAVDNMLTYSPVGSTVEPGLPMPRWGWNGPT